jgi:hypothetical protein
MTVLTLRSVKGSALTHNEVDANWIALRDTVDGVVNVATYGAVADGSAHPLSERYGTLAAAQAVYPFATSLTQQIDYCACKQASNVAFGADAAEHGNTNRHLNKILRIPAGNYWFGDDTWLIRNLVGGRIEGAGELATTIRGNETILAFDGIWYTKIGYFSVQCSTALAEAAMELDGNVPGHPYTTRGVQAVTLEGMLIDGGGSLYALTMCRLGGSAAQGSECLFLKVHLSSASLACYYQSGFNALANTFMGGNCQGYTKHGIYVVLGTIAIINTGFQSVTGYTQILNDGYDIKIGEGGATESCIIYGCRSESIRFFHNTGSVTAHVSACVMRNGSVGGWGGAGTVYPANSGIIGIDAVNRARLFATTAGGTSGGTEPVWPMDGTPIADGTVTWDEVDFYAMYNGNGTIDFATCYPFQGGGTASYGPGKVECKGPVRAIDATEDYYLLGHDRLVVVDATAAPVNVYLPQAEGLHSWHEYIVRKSDTSANAVIVHGGIRTFDTTGTNEDTIVGGSRGYRRYVQASVFGGTSWIVVGSS